MIILGDQFPLNGGFLRRKMLMEAMAKGEIETGNVRYDLHDVDAPWKQDGAGTVLVTRRWTDYWSLGIRNPLTLSIPGVEMENIKASLGLPTGLVYLTGPVTSRTIRSENKSIDVLEKVRLIVLESVVWLARLAVLMGKEKEEINEKKERISRLAVESRSIRELFMSIGEECSGCGKMDSTWEIYKESPIERVYLPREYFWTLSDEGQRFNLDQIGILNSNLLVPKGAALFLDFSRRGYWTGFTGCEYLESTKEIRDRYLPEQPIKLVRIGFNWELDVDVVGRLIRVFQEKKAKRGKGVPEINQKELEKVKDYWRARPTELAYYFLGGTLRVMVKKIIV